MKTQLIAIALCLGGCVDTVDIDEPADPVANDEPPRILEKVDRPCEHVIATDGPCAVACDPDKVATFITDGCVLFVCKLDDGNVYNVGGCKH